MISLSVFFSRIRNNQRTLKNNFFWSRKLFSAFASYNTYVTGVILLEIRQRKEVKITLKKQWRNCFNSRCKQVYITSDYLKKKHSCLYGTGSRPNAGQRVTNDSQQPRMGVEARRYLMRILLVKNRIYVRMECHKFFIYTIWRTSR